MTEFVVAAAFVMVPLFIIVPTVGKYIDMKQATIQAARYASWEYTANYVDKRDQPGGFSGPNNYTMPKKTPSVIVNEARQRFFSDTSTPISSSVDRGGYNANNRNSLWTYHNGLPMYDEGTRESHGLEGSSPTPDKGLIVSRAIGVIGTVTGFIGALLPNAGFDAINPDGDTSVDGQFTADLSIPVENAPMYTPFNTNNTAPLFGADLDLKMEARSGILTESWGAGGKSHTVFQAGGLVPTSLLSGGVVQTVLNVMSFIAPSLHPTSLKFGYPVKDPDVMDQVPAGALENDTRSVLCPGGKCEHYEP